MESNPADGRERLIPGQPIEPGPVNPHNAHQWGCVCADCMHWWGTPAGQSIRRMWDDEHHDDSPEELAAIARGMRTLSRRNAPTTGSTAAPEIEGQGDEDQEEEDPDDGQRPQGLRPTHYSTGRLTARQAETVNKWRRALLRGGSDRPKASTSDALAVCVQALLDDPPPAREIAWYAVKSKQAHRAAATTADVARAGGPADGPEVPRHPPVSFYLPWSLAERYETLLLVGEVRTIEEQIDAQAVELFPRRGQATERRAWISDQLRDQQIPQHLPPPPAGTLARMAIDRWRRVPVATVIAEAVAYGAAVHSQHHRAREDMRRLER